MRVQCALCDKIDNIPDFSTVAKKLRNKPIRTYLCEQCDTRITENTKARIATGRFKLYRSSHTTEDQF